MPCLSNLYLSMPCLVPPSFPSPSSASPSSAPQQTSFTHTLSTSGTSSPPAVPQKCSLMSLTHHRRMILHLSTSISTSILNWASRHFLKIVDGSCPFLSNQVLSAIWVGKCRYPETRNSGKCWFPGYFSVISKHGGKIDDWVLPVLLSLGLVPINRNTQNYS